MHYESAARSNTDNREVSGRPGLPGRPGQPGRPSPLIRRGDSHEILRPGSPADGLDQAGWEGLILHGFSHSVLRFEVVQSPRYEQLAPTIEAARSHARLWLEGGMSRRLYRSVDSVVSYHGIFDSCVPFLRGAVDGWGDAEKREGAVQRLEDLALESSRIGAATQARHDELASFRKSVVTDTGQLQGILDSMAADADPEKVTAVHAAIDFQTKLIDGKNEALRTARGIEAGIGVAMAVSAGLGLPGLVTLGIEIWQLDESVERVNQLSEEIEAAVQVKQQRLAELARIEVDAAYAKAASGPIHGLVNKMHGATQALQNEIARWQRLTTELEVTAEQVQAAAGSGEEQGRSALRRVLTARADLDDALAVAKQIKGHETLPVEEVQV